MAKYYLSKSDFKVAMTCPAKLYYRKLKFPTTMEGNEFMEMLAEGDYMVG
jgi:CRISPR/Cas system-associated exonuclease Cas4 (RecB family)